ncbi:DUF2249 domain-containing protein [Aquisalimonas sp. 2447]|uniref:DUF2249 domain-containing protein n=1 Tax=Aquisalimonas sp. 2447 TaxID=2740807 RepID=UPI0014326FB9|nr:DUF2249 domain-containing protein [Aquisalimonas sp. 2447]QIT55334.1 DUF2249 domain-containing protein [Aquisalimonas sp. 2447]
MAHTVPKSALEHQYTAVLDLRVHDPRERLPLLELTLGALTPGEDLLLVTDAEPERLRGHIHERYAGVYTWEQLESGPVLWRARLLRLSPDNPA